MSIFKEPLEIRINFFAVLGVFLIMLFSLIYITIKRDNAISSQYPKIEYADSLKGKISCFHAIPSYFRVGKRKNLFFTLNNNAKYDINGDADYLEFIETLAPGDSLFKKANSDTVYVLRLNPKIGEKERDFFLIQNLNSKKEE